MVSALRAQSLGTKLIFFSTILTVLTLSVAFLVLSISLEHHTRKLLADTLAQHQRTLSNLRQGKLDELLRTSTLLSDSPTLRAAMETFALESGPGLGGRSDLLATIQNEADRVSAGLGGGLLVVTDREGVVLAVSGSSPARPRVGESFAVHQVVRDVLAQTGAPRSSFAVLDLDGTSLRVGCVPIVLQGFVIGTLALGDVIDHEFARGLERTFNCDVLVAAGGTVLASTLPHGLGPADLAALSELRLDESALPAVVRLASDEFVAARESLGPDGHGGRVELYLLGSLSGYLDDSNRRLLLIVLGCGISAVVVGAVAARWMARSVLHPLDAFVRFVRSVASRGDLDRRFVHEGACVEVETLNDAYNHLMDSLLEHEQRLVRQAREDLERLERLKESEKLAALGRTLSGAAHEINNPLTGVVGHVELLLRDPATPLAVRERLQRVKREGDRVVALVRSVLKVSHRKTEQTAEVDLAKMLHETVEMRRHDFIGAGMTLEVGIEPLRVVGNELELQQVFLNIINNAYDALREFTLAGRLSIRASEQGGRAVIVFADNGPGMKDPKQVFEHFYTTKPVGKGTGLGLSICHAIVHEHGGRIVAENRREGGAAFVIELPLAQPVDVAETLVTRPAPGALAAGPLEASVLVVDDEPMIVELQREILQSLGAAVVEASSGAEAIERLRERAFDLVVSDVKMPGAVSGQALFRWIESHRPEARGRVLFVTGDTAGDGSRAFVESVGARCVVKPFSADDYVRAVREVIREHSTA